MNKALLDTDILSEILRARNPIVVQRVSLYKAAFGSLTISSITVMEIIKGLHKVNRDDATRKFLEGLTQTEILTFDHASAQVAGRIYGDLERLGQPIGRADPMIAAIAIQNNLTLASGNTEHYQRIQALGYPLEMDNWRQPLAQP